MSYYYFVGQRVVCVDTTGWDENDYLSWSYPRVGDICTINAKYVAQGQLSLCLVEHQNKHQTKSGFYAWRFRPLVSDTKKVFLTDEAPNDSERWDNRKQKVRS